MNILSGIWKQACLLSVLMLVMIVAGCGKPAINKSPNQMPEKLVKIQKLYNEGKINKVCSESKKWIKKNSNSKYLEVALKTYADALYDKKDYYQSYLKYEELLNQFGATKHFTFIINREIEIGKLFLAGQKRIFWNLFRVTARLEGLKILDDIDSRWPGSKAAAMGIMLRADHFYQKGLFFEAEQEYQRLVTSYNSSCHFPRALFQLAESKRSQYEGSFYDGICLDEAAVHYQQYQIRFPEKAKAKGVDDTLAWIRLEKVKKEYEIADFYFRTGKTKQAIIYWQSVFEMAPESEYGNKAVKMIQNVQIDEHKS